MNKIENGISDNAEAIAALPITGDSSGHGGNNFENIIIANDKNSGIVLSKNVSVFGTDNTAGMLGYYYSNIDIANKRITLSTAHSGGTAIDEVDYAVGDVISIVNGAKYNDCSKITAINGNVITVNKLPFTSVVSETADFDNYCIYCTAKPGVGIAELGRNAIAFGETNQSLNRDSFATGRDNKAVGQYGFVAGRENTVAYAGFAAGRKNNIPHDYSCGIG